MSPPRSDEIAVLFERCARRVTRLVSARANVPAAVIEDACQTAWLRLCAHSEVEPCEEVAVQWLVITATREAWKRSRAGREEPVGSWLGEPDHDAELPDPVGEASDPSELVLVHRERVARLGALTARERRFLGLQAIGLSYSEVAAVGEASLRTVERQIERGRRKLGLLRSGSAVSGALDLGSAGG